MNKVRKLGFITLLALFATSAFATNLKSIVDQYYLIKELRIDQDPRDPCQCRPSTSCFRTACESMGNYECDDSDEQNNIRRACRGVWGGGCISQSVGLLHKFEYDDNDEMVQLVNSCRGVYDLECVSYSCRRMGNFGCDDLEEVIEVNRACAGYL